MQWRNGRKKYQSKLRPCLQSGPPEGRGPACLTPPRRRPRSTSFARRERGDPVTNHCPINQDAIQIGHNVNRARGSSTSQGREDRSAKGRFLSHETRSLSFLVQDKSVGRLALPRAPSSTMEMRSAVLVNRAFLERLDGLRPYHALAVSA